MKRGSVLMAPLPGSFGKPQPAVIVQAEVTDSLRSVVICPLTEWNNDEGLFTPLVEPTSENGLDRRYVVRVDRTMPVPRRKIVNEIGTLDAQAMEQVTRGLAVLLGLA